LHKSVIIQAETRFSSMWVVISGTKCGFTDVNGPLSNTNMEPCRDEMNNYSIFYYIYEDTPWETTSLKLNKLLKNLR